MRLTVRMVSAYVRSNAVPARDLPNIVGLVHRSIVTLSAEDAPSAATGAARGSGLTRDEIIASIHHDFLVSFEDGQRYKMLRRHLTGLGLTPEAYRAKWGLPHHYPMIAPAYSERRREISRAIQAGRRLKLGADA